MIGGRRSQVGPVEAHKDTILAVLEATPDIAIEELRGALQGKGLVFGYLPPYSPDCRRERSRCPNRAHCNWRRN